MDMVGGTIFMSPMAGRKLDEQWIDEVRSIVLAGHLRSGFEVQVDVSSGTTLHVPGVVPTGIST